MKSANVGLAPRRDRHEDALPKVVAALDGARRVLCVMHQNPDGDAAGSTLGLALSLLARGKDVTLFCSTDLPYNLRFLPGLERLVRALPAEGAWDATVVCDVGASHRIGPGLPDRARQGVVLNIDHHLTSDDFGDVNYVDAEAASVGVLIHRILRAMGQPLGADAATALYTSVLTDTGSFRYSSTNPEALHCAADLVAAGADPWTVSSQIYEQQPVERMRLLSEALGTLHVSDDGLFACITVTRAMREAARGRPEVTEGFVNFARSIRGVEIAAQVNEPEAGDEAAGWPVSFRSRGKVNAARIAQRFGGGGHHNAAGCRVPGDLAQVRRRIGEAVGQEFALLAQGK